MKNILSTIVLVSSFVFVALPAQAEFYVKLEQTVGGCRMNIWNIYEDGSHGIGRSVLFPWSTCGEKKFDEDGVLMKKLKQEYSKLQLKGNK